MERRDQLNISWELLRAFIAAGSARTFGEAAAGRHVTVSAISQQVKALERALGQPLFERVGRNARLTADGRRLLDRLAPQAQQIDQALLELRERHGAVAGEVAVGSPRAFGAKWLRPRLAALLAQHDQLSLNIEFDVPSVLERRLRAGALDLCILVRPSQLPGLATRPIATETFIAVASPGYAKRFGDFETARYIVFDDDLPMHAVWWRARFGRAAPPASRIAARVASLDEMRALAEAGVGIAVLPDYFVADRRGLVALETKGRPARNTIFLAWRQGMVETGRFAAVKAALA